MLALGASVPCAAVAEIWFSSEFRRTSIYSNLAAHQTSSYSIHQPHPPPPQGLRSALWTVPRAQRQAHRRCVSMARSTVVYQTSKRANGTGSRTTGAGRHGQRCSASRPLRARAKPYQALAARPATPRPSPARIKERTRIAVSQTWKTALRMWVRRHMGSASRWAARRPLPPRRHERGTQRCRNFATRPGRRRRACAAAWARA